MTKKRYKLSELTGAAYIVALFCVIEIQEELPECKLVDFLKFFEKLADEYEIFFDENGEMIK